MSNTAIQGPNCVHELTISNSGRFGSLTIEGKPRSVRSCLVASFLPTGAREVYQTSENIRYELWPWWHPRRWILRQRYRCELYLERLYTFRIEAAQ